MEVCTTMPDAGEELCPRHKFLSEQTVQAKGKKAATKAAALGRALPNTRRALITLGYGFRGNAPCRDCREPMEWWKTPMGKMAPYNSMPEEDSPAISHFATCVHAQNFRKVS